MKSFFQEKNGDLSSVRLGFILWVTAVLAVWIVVSVRESVLQPLPDSVILILFTLMTGKVAQKYGEK